jgi:hypothetical protein
MIQTHFKSKHNGLPTFIVYPIDCKCGAPFSITLVGLQIKSVRCFHISRCKIFSPILTFYEIDSSYIALAGRVGIIGELRAGFGNLHRAISGASA